MSGKTSGAKKAAAPRKRPSEKVAPPSGLAPKAIEAPAMEICLAIRLRGAGGIRPEIRKTLSSLRLFRKYSATLVEKRSDVLGMLRKAKDMVTWGEISRDGLLELLRRRARLPGNERVTDAWVERCFNYKSVDELAAAVAGGDVSLDQLWKRGIKPVFRLHPPKGGFRYTIKRPFQDMGELGYRGPVIDQLVLRMV